MRVAIFLLLAVVAPALADNSGDYFPLEKGMSWIYQGEVSWAKRNPATNENETKKQTLTWKMEVVNTLQKDIVFAALLKGFPNDLSWYEAGKERGDWCIVRVGTGQYHLFGGEDAKKAWARLQSDKETISDMLNENTLFLDVPLLAGKVYGEFINTPRARYCWLVEDETKFDRAKIKGVPETAAGTLFTLIYRTSPDHQFMDFVPGLGITRYVYGHHGTVSECNMELIEFVPASGKASQEKKTQ